MGLVSDGGVHSSLEHLFKLCDLLEAYGIPEAYVHCFMDGRDTDPAQRQGVFHRCASAPYLRHEREKLPR